MATKKQHNLKIEPHLYGAFSKITEAKDTTPTKVLNDFVKDYVLKNLDVLTSKTDSKE